jgi:hypothetical protein
LEGASPLRLLVATPQPHLEEPDTAPFWSDQLGLSAWRDVLRVLIERLL